MESFSSFNAYIQKAIVGNWDQDALTDYQGVTRLIGLWLSWLR